MRALWLIALMAAIVSASQEGRISFQQYVEPGVLALFSLNDHDYVAEHGVPQLVELVRVMDSSLDVEFSHVCSSVLESATDDDQQQFTVGPGHLYCVETISASELFHLFSDPELLFSDFAWLLNPNVTLLHDENHFWSNAVVPEINSFLSNTGSDVKRAFQSSVPTDLVSYGETIVKVIQGVRLQYVGRLMTGVHDLVHAMCAAAIRLRAPTRMPVPTLMYVVCRDVMGADSEWSRLLMRASGQTPLSIVERGVAVLRLFQETVSRLKGAMRPKTWEQRELSRSTKRVELFLKYRDVFQSKRAVSSSEMISFPSNFIDHLVTPDVRFIILTGSRSRTTVSDDNDQYWADVDVERLVDAGSAVKNSVIRSENLVPLPFGIQEKDPGQLIVVGTHELEERLTHALSNAFESYVGAPVLMDAKVIYDRDGTWESEIRPRISVERIPENICDIALVSSVAGDLDSAVVGVSKLIMAISRRKSGPLQSYLDDFAVGLCISAIKLHGIQVSSANYYYENAKREMGGHWGNLLDRAIGIHPLELFDRGMAVLALYKDMVRAVPEGLATLETVLAVERIDLFLSETDCVFC